MILQKKKLIKAYFSVLGGFLTHLVLGAFYLWGNITLYATSYFRLNGYPDLTKTKMLSVFPFIYVGISFGSFTGIPIARRIGHKITSSIIMIVYALSVLIASKSNNFILFATTMGFIPGLCVGNEYLIPVDNAVGYYPDKKGLIYGLILCGLGFSLLVFNPILQYFINPYGISPNDDGYYPIDVVDNFQSGLFKMFLIYLTVGLGGALMMFQLKQKDKSQALLQVQDSQRESTQEVEISKEIILKSIQSTKQLLQQKYLYLFWGVMYSISGFGLMIASQYKLYGITKIQHDDNFFSLVGSLGGFSNGMSRFFWSALLDYISPNTLMIINISMMIALAGTFNLVATSKVCFLIWIVLIYFQYGGIFTYFPTVCTKTFGQVYGPYAYNIIFTAVMCSNFTQYFLTEYLVQKIQYVGIFYIYCGIGIVGMVIQLIIIKNNKIQKQ